MINLVDIHYILVQHIFNMEEESASQTHFTLFLSHYLSWIPH